MAAYPTIDQAPMLEPWNEELEWKTLIGEFGDEGAEQRKQKRLFVKRNLSIKYQDLSKTEARYLYDFYLARKGAFEAFNLFHPYPDTYTAEYVATGDGATLLFNLPGKLASSYTLYVSGIEAAEVTEYTVWSEGGADGADKVTFGVAPADGAYITWSFSGYLKVRARFMEDRLAFETFYDRLVNAGLKTKGLLNA